MKDYNGLPCAFCKKPSHMINNPSKCKKCKKIFCGWNGPWQDSCASIHGYQECFDKVKPDKNGYWWQKENQK